MEASYSVSFENQDQGELQVGVAKNWKEVRESDGLVLRYMTAQLGNMKILLTDEGTIKFEFRSPDGELVNEGTIASKTHINQFNPEGNQNA